MGHWSFRRLSATILMVSAEDNMPVVLSAELWQKKIPARIQSMPLTRFHNINPDIINTGLNLFRHKFGGSVVDFTDSKGILSGQSCRCRHRIASVSSDDLLVRFETATTCCQCRPFRELMD